MNRKNEAKWHRPHARDLHARQLPTVIEIAVVLLLSIRSDLTIAVNKCACAFCCFVLYACACHYFFWRTINRFVELSRYDRES